jgi:hypothetical protein
MTISPRWKSPPAGCMRAAKQQFTCACGREREAVGLPPHWSEHEAAVECPVCSAVREGGMRIRFARPPAPASGDDPKRRGARPRRSSADARARAEVALLAHHERGDLWLARSAGVDAGTVARIRRKLEQTGAIPFHAQLLKSDGRLGRRRAAA